MTTRKYLLLSLAAVFLSAPFAVTADAATRARKPMHHSSAHAGRHARGGAATDADHSADSLNAQSLSRTQGAQ